MISQPIDSKRAGLRNERLILRILRERGALSQTELCGMTGLGSSTASSIVSRLREKGLILESEGQSTKRGPKPVILEINPRSRFIVGVEINPDVVMIGLFDFTTELIDTIKIGLDKDHQVEQAMEQLTINLLGLFDRHDVKQEQILGIGIALSGTISSDGQVVLSSPMGWKNVPLLERLSRRLECPVRLYSTRVRLLAEMAMESNGSFRNVLYVNVADGVGCSTTIDGQLLQGATGRSGEMGHIVVDPSGPQCGCGHKGCLEAFISGPALAKRILDDRATEPSSWLKDNISPEDNHKTIIKKWGEALHRNDAYALTLCQAVSDYLGKAVAMAVNLYDPELVILAGYVCQACGGYIQPALAQSIEQMVYNSDSRRIAIRPAAVGDQSIVIGTAMAIWQQEVGV